MSTLIPNLVVIVVALPAIAFLVTGVAWLMGRPLAERSLARLTASTMAAATLVTVVIAVRMLSEHVQRVTVPLGNLFSVGTYEFPVVLLVDRLSLPFMVLIVVLSGIVGWFSVRYVHRESGFQRFFLLMQLFTVGMLLLVCAGSIDLLLAGWELVGLTSVLLIAFFQERPAPVNNALRAFVTYRACDIGLLTAAVLLHHGAGTAMFDAAWGGPWPGGHDTMSAGAATLLAALLAWAAMGKSAQVPLSGWLPRAMEGPTPSSAIFYGALSIHAGPYLLLRAAPVLDRAPFVSAALVVIGAASAVHGVLVGRAQSDAKTSLAYASMAQVGIIIAEIGLGFRLLVVLHIAGHATVRTMQLLRAPSMLHDHHRVEAAAGGHFSPTGYHYEKLLPARLRGWLYRLALARGHHDTLLELMVVGPVLRLTEALDRGERAWVRLLSTGRLSDEVSTHEARDSIPEAAASQPAARGEGR